MAKEKIQKLICRKAAYDGVPDIRRIESITNEAYNNDKTADERIDAGKRKIAQGEIKARYSIYN